MQYTDTDDTGPATAAGEIVKEAVERWKACEDWQGIEDERSREDTKFANGDERNNWQWPQAIYNARSGEGGADLPSTTINNTRTHNDIIINQLSKNDYGIKIRPTGGHASYESAKVMQSLVRRIEYISKASTHYRKVAEQQVDGGIGYILLETKYVSNKSRNQDIYLRSSRDATGVYLDPWIKEPDGSDANFGFVFDRMPRKEFNRKHKKYKNKVGTAPIDSQFAPWLNDKEIMLAKYFRKNEKPDTYVWWKDEQGEEHEMLSSEIKDDAGKEIHKALLAEIEAGTIEGGTRKVTDDEVEWFLIAGDTIIEKGKWAGRYIPIARCVGRELVIDATLDRKGHTRPMIGPQRMLNYSCSSSIESVASQTKSPWLAPARAIEGQEGWKTANIDRFGVLLYNDVDDEADPQNQTIPAPQRIDTAKPNEGWLSIAQSSERHMMMISGQWQSETGQQSNNMIPESGKAIGERKEQGDVATYHFTEHRGDMLRYIGVQLLDLIPKIYDTKRALHIEDDAGQKSWIMIDPDQKNVLEEIKQLKQDEQAAKIAFNPTIGEYECVSDPGPDFATQRQEAADAMKTLMASNNELIAVASDLLFKNLDFPGADEISERLKKEIRSQKPYLFDDSTDPQTQALQQQVQKLVGLNSELMQKLAEKGLQLRGKQELRDVEAYNAETTRMEAKDRGELGMLKIQLEMITKLLLTPDQKQQMEHEMLLKSADMDHEHATMSNQHIFTLIQQANDAALNPKSNGADGTQ